MPTRSIFMLAPFAALLLLLSACASSPYRSALPSLSASKQAEVTRRILYYGDAPVSTVQSVSDESDELAQRFLACLSPDLKDRFRHDPLLDLVADESAYWVGAKGKLPFTGMMRWMGWRYGQTGNYVHGNYSWAQGGDVGTRLDRMFAETCEKYNTEKPMDKRVAVRFGIARINYQLSRYIQTIVFYENAITLEPLPKAPRIENALTLKGRINRPVTKPRLILSQGGSKFKTFDLALDPDGTFFVSLPLPKKAAIYHLYVGALDKKEGESEADEAGKWRRPLLWLPIYMGAPEPPLPPKKLSNPNANPEDVSSWAALVLQRYNALRKKYKRAPLSLSPEASALATQQALLFVDDPETPLDTQLEKKLKEQGVAVKSVQQMYRSFKDLDDQLWQNLNQPLTRSDILQKNASQIGIGVAKGHEKEFKYVEYILTMDSKDTKPDTKPDDAKDDAKPDSTESPTESAPDNEEATPAE